MKNTGSIGKKKWETWAFGLFGVATGLCQSTGEDLSHYDSAYKIGYVLGSIVCGYILGILIWCAWDKGYKKTVIAIILIIVIGIVHGKLVSPISLETPVDREAFARSCSEGCYSKWSAQTGDAESPVWKFTDQQIAGMCSCGCGGMAMAINDRELRAAADPAKSAHPSAYFQELASRHLQSCYEETIKSINQLGVIRKRT